MDIEITAETDDTVEFTVEDVSPAFANALRRTMIGDIPTLAIEDVRITQNTSGIFDEILAHRLGLLPWTFDPDDFIRRADCDCEDGCPRCTVTVALQTQGDEDVTAADITVPADDVAPAHPDAAIVSLQGGEIDLEADAVLGTGREHAKWQAANAAYTYDEDGTFHFTVETVSGLTPRTVVNRAIDRLQQRTDQFADAVTGET